jgi:uncharacterized protein (TIGR02145 family)
MKKNMLILCFLISGFIIIPSCKETEKEMMISTGSASNITVNSAEVSGYVSDVGKVATQHGHCYAKTANPTVDSLKTELGAPLLGDFTSNLSNLEFGTKYYVKAYMSNSREVVYGNEINFTTTVTATDADGNIYNIVKIGTQFWIKENLKTTKLNDGTSIPNVTDTTAWSNLSTPGYCWYNNDSTYYKAIHGALYNWYTVNTGKLCPVGWHVPTMDEWTILTDFLTINGYGYQGSGDDIAKSLAATGGWSVSSYPGAPGNDLTSNNSSGFTAYPSGKRWESGDFYSIDKIAFWWTSTSYNTNSAYYIAMSCNSEWVSSENWLKQSGRSVRCLKDN